MHRSHISSAAVGTHVRPPASALRACRTAAAIALAVLASLQLSIPLAAQAPDTVVPDQAPRFLLASSGRSGKAVSVDVGRTPLLRQRISLELHDVPLERALRAIAAESGLDIAYSKTTVPLDRTVRIDARDITVASALREVLTGVDVDVVFSSTGRAMLVKRPARADGIIVGRVTEARSGTPLEAVSVVVDGTRSGVLTAEDGSYRIPAVPAGEHTVIARRIGYTPGRKNVTVTGDQEVTVDFQLSADALRMSEVVVTGTSVETTRRQLGNAVGTVDAQEISKSGSVAIDRALAGKAAGVMVQQNSGNPGGGISVRLRGTNTILGSADPLYIVDGVIVNNDTPDLIYLGGYSQNRLVDLNPEDVDHIEIVKGAAAAALYGSRANNGVVQIFTKRGMAGKPRLTWTSTIQADQLRKRLKVNTYPFDADGNPVTRYDQQDLIFHTGIGTEHAASLSGGSEASRYYLSAGYVNDNGIVRASNFTRASARARLDQTLSSWATLSVGGAFNFSHDQDIPNGGLGSLYGAIDGFLFGPNTYDARPESNGVYSHDGSYANPAEVIDKYDFGQKTNRFIGDAHLTLTPIDGLKLEYTLGYDGYDQRATAFIPRGTGTPGIYALGYSRQGSRDFTAVNNNVNINYSSQLTPWLHSTSSIGGTVQYEVSNSTGASSYDLTPVTETVPSGANWDISEYRSTRIVEGIFGQQTFGFGDRLYLTAAGRLDASSVFGEADRWQAYPKLSGSYVLSEEDFWGDSFLGRIFPQFKLRAAWGNSGGLTAIGPFARFTNYSPVSYENLPGLVQQRQQGSEIKPERQTALEGGIDATLFSNRLGFELTVYKQHTKDLLLTRTVALSTGFSTRLENAGEIDNNGVELLVRATPVAKPGVTWNTTVSYSSNHNEVSGIEGGVRVLGNSWGLAAAINGEPLGVYYGAGYARDAQGRILDKNGEVFTDPKTQVPGRDPTPRILGDPNPDWIGSWINDVQVGENLSFRAQLDGVFGNDVWNYDARIGAYPPYGTLDLYGQELAGNIAAGTGKALWLNFERWVEDGSYVKVREVSATYTFHPRSLGIADLGVSVIGRNLYSFDNYSGYDPETNAGGQSTGTRGYQFGEVPIPRSFVLRINASF
jgi:TonB-dependent SusC/RagA subfamily outer membrane receptor